MDGSQNARCKPGTMTGKAIGQYFSFASTSSPADPEHVQRRERRGRVRTKLRWSLLFRDRHGETMESTTENLSSQGFYCLCQTPVACGEVLLCWVTVPTHDPSGDKGPMVLECDVRVVRTEAASAGTGFGVACRIEDYRFSNHEARSPFEGLRQSTRSRQESGPAAKRFAGVPISDR